MMGAWGCLAARDPAWPSERSHTVTRQTLTVTALLALLVAPGPASAHGVWGHIHVTGWAIENLPDGPLHDFFAEDPDILNAALFGAAFTDSGYWPISEPLKAAAHAYGEHTHWEPFVNDFIQWIRDNDPPPWTEVDSKIRVAFLMGCASHGLQDEVFDSLFLLQVDHHDGSGQDVADPGTDGFLVLDGHLRFIPTEWLPMETLLELYASLDQDVTAEVIQAGVDMATALYVNGDVGPAIARSLGERHAPTIPWARQHYLDPEVPGSLHSEIMPTGGYLQAIWDRLHGAFDPNQAVIHTFPDPPRRLAGLDPASPDPWVTVIYGAGVERSSGGATWIKDGGDPVAFERKNTRWNAKWTRLHRLLPSQALDPGAWYTVEVTPGLDLIDGTASSVATPLHFQTPCATADDPACPDLGPLPTAEIDGPTPPDPGPEPGPEPATEDASVAESAPAAEPAAEADPVAEAEPMDGAEPSPAAEPASPDAGGHDLTPATTQPAAPATGGDGGGCAAARAGHPGDLWLAACVAWLALALRRRRRSALPADA